MFLSTLLCLSHRRLFFFSPETLERKVLKFLTLRLNLSLKVLNFKLRVFKFLTLRLNFFKPRANDYTAKQLILLKGLLDYNNNVFCSRFLLLKKKLLTSLVILKCGSGSGKTFLLIVLFWLI